MRRAIFDLEQIVELATDEIESVRKTKLELGEKITLRYWLSRAFEEGARSSASTPTKTPPRSHD